MVDAVLKFYTVRYAIHTRRYEQVKHPTATQGRKAYERHLGIHGRMTIELMCDNPRWSCFTHSMSTRLTYGANMMPSTEHTTVAVSLCYLLSRYPSATLPRPDLNPNPVLSCLLTSKQASKPGYISADSSWWAPVTHVEAGHWISLVLAGSGRSFIRGRGYELVVA
jgi:hypothetical protein